MKRDSYISRQEAAQILGVNAQTISNYIDRGLLSYKQIGNMKYLKRTEIEEMKDQFVEYEANRNLLTNLIIEQVELKKKVEARISSFKTNLEDLACAEELIFGNLKILLATHRNYFNEREKFLIDTICSQDHLGVQFRTIADALNVSRERLRQIIVRMFRRLVDYQNEEQDRSIKNREKIEELEEQISAYKISEKMQEKRSATISEIQGYSRSVLKQKVIDVEWVDWCHRKKVGVSVRCLNCLRAADIETIADLVTYTKQDLLKFRNFGKKSLTELDDMLECLGLHFGMSEHEVFHRSAITYKNAPEIVFLQTGLTMSEGSTKEIDFSELSEVTWSYEKVFDTDIAYRRTDL